MVLDRDRSGRFTYTPFGSEPKQQIPEITLQIMGEPEVIVDAESISEVVVENEDVVDVVENPPEPEVA